MIYIYKVVVRFQKIKVVKFNFSRPTDQEKERRLQRSGRRGKRRRDWPGRGQRRQKGRGGVRSVRRRWVEGILS